jgi:hypothetical protein
MIEPPVTLAPQKSGWRKCERYKVLFARRSLRTPFLDNFRIVYSAFREVCRSPMWYEVIVPAPSIDPTNSVFP